MDSREKLAESLSAELDALQKKYNCSLGVWLTWRDLLHNFGIMKKDPEINELHFGIQMRIHGTNNKNKTSNKK